MASIVSFAGGESYSLGYTRILNLNLFFICSYILEKTFSAEISKGTFFSGKLSKICLPIFELCVSGKEKKLL